MTAVDATLTTASPVPPTNPALLRDQVRNYARQSNADNALRVYQGNQAHFMNWCDGRGLTVLPARASGHPPAPCRRSSTLASDSSSVLPEKLLTWRSISHFLSNAISKSADVSPMQITCWDTQVASSWLWTVLYLLATCQVRVVQ